MTGSVYVPAIGVPLEKLIRDSTLLNLSEHSSIHHSPMDLYTFADDCPHPNPEGQEKYEGLDDLLDEWMREHHPDLRPDSGGKENWKHWYDVRAEGMKAIPLYVEFQAAMDEYEEHHSGRVCMLSPMGSTCRAVECMDGDEESCEPGECRRQENAREAMDEFWGAFSTESIGHIR